MLIIAAVFFLTSMDATIKFLSESYSVIQLVWIRYFGQTFLVTVLLFRHVSLLWKTRHPVLQVVRSLCLLGGTFCFFTGFINTDLVSATTILQTSPLVIAVLAHLVLGEKIGWQRILGIAVGLAGALVIIRPGTAVFSPYSLFSAGAAVCYAAFSILTRRLSRDENIWSSFLFTTAAGAVISTLIAPLSWQAPDLLDIPWFALAAVCGAAGHYLFIKAHFLAEASALAPFTYASLIFAAVNGAFLFGDIPDFWTITGVFVVVGSGLFVWYRETRPRAAC